jgi:uncharacterized protein
MTALSERILQAWDGKEGPVVLATVDAKGAPNIIYATCVQLFGNDCVVVADNYFNKTRKNLLEGSQKGSVLFLHKDGNAYQIKGRLEYHIEGALFDFMKTWNPVKHPGRAAAILQVEECYSGAERI